MHPRVVQVAAEVRNVLRLLLEVCFVHHGSPDVADDSHQGYSGELWVDELDYF